MNREKTKQLPIGFTERQRSMIEEIMRELGYPSLSSVVQQAVIDMYQAVKAIKVTNEGPKPPVEEVVEPREEANEPKPDAETKAD